MATIPLPERAVAIDTLMTVAGEDVALGGTILDYLRTAFPGFDWPGILRTRAATWQPYIDNGLSITQFVDEVIRISDVLAASRA